MANRRIACANRGWLVTLNSSAYSLKQGQIRGRMARARNLCGGDCIRRHSACSGSLLHDTLGGLVESAASTHRHASDYP